MSGSPGPSGAKYGYGTSRGRFGTKSTEELAAETPEEQTGIDSDRPQSSRYPERHMPIAGVEPRAEMWAAEGAEPPADTELQAALDRYDLFSAARERLLKPYRYNTARAYWGDLDSIFFWCEHRELDIFDLTDRQLRQYFGLLRRRKYSENTIRRHGVAYRLFRRIVDE